MFKRNLFNLIDKIISGGFMYMKLKKYFSKPYAVIILLVPIFVILGFFSGLYYDFLNYNIAEESYDLENASYQHEYAEPSSLIIEVINPNLPSFTLRKNGSKDILVKSIWLEVVNVKKLPPKYLYPKLCPGFRVEPFDINKTIKLRPDENNQSLINRSFLVTDELFTYSTSDIDIFEGIRVDVTDGFEYKYRFKVEWCELNESCIAKNTSSDEIIISMLERVSGFELISNATKEIFIILNGYSSCDINKESIYRMVEKLNPDMEMKIILDENASHIVYKHGGCTVGEDCEVKSLCKSLDNKTDMYRNYTMNISEMIKVKNIDLKVGEIKKELIEKEFAIIDNKTVLVNRGETIFNPEEIMEMHSKFFDIWDKSSLCYI